MSDLRPHHCGSIQQVFQLMTEQVLSCLRAAAAAAPLQVLQEHLQQVFIALQSCQPSRLVTNEVKSD